MIDTSKPDPRRSAPATTRNRGPILEVLRTVLPPAGTVLEIASGSGEHAVYFASELTKLTWQPSDPDPQAQASIAAWREAVGSSNLLAPLDLDAAADAWPDVHADAMVCINMVHISPWAATVGLLAGAARLLDASQPLVLYGPFRRTGYPLESSNEVFDINLRRRNSEWGLRSVEQVQNTASEHGLALIRQIAMPANNLMLVFHKQ